ncbi:hypothetical protein SLS56_009132 [Neofusicoccum ribis]|uniref:Uncharacterized protein n=1 Tax=Neofusicoccum ribis TaxID=45134 RepID=A0ABR3SI91_9PEZI
MKTVLYLDLRIAGFVEGAMLSALVSIKIVNKEKQEEVVNAVDSILGVQCGAFRYPQDVDFATKALAELAEITIQLHSTGSAILEPAGQPRTLEFLRDIASKFPARAAMNPERIAVILTKYGSLHGYQALRSTGSITACYEHTSLYTDALMDSFMEFQNFDRRLSAQQSDIKAGTKQFDVVDGYALALDIDSDHSRAQNRYESSWSGLARAKRECLVQMMKIANEVEEIRKNPSIATDIARIEGFQSPLEFNDQLPKVKEVAELRCPEKVCSQMVLFDGDSLALSESERKKMGELLNERPAIGEHLRLALPYGSEHGDLFCSLDFLKPEWIVAGASVTIVDGVVCALGFRYTNGLES